MPRKTRGERAIGQGNRERVSENDFKMAESVIRRKYYGDMVMGIVEDLIRAVADGEIATEEDHLDSLHQVIDGALIYTHDQYITIFASDNSSDGLEEYKDSGGELGDNFLGGWAYYTLERDVQESLERSDEWKELEKPWD